MDADWVMRVEAAKLANGLLGPQIKPGETISLKVWNEVYRFMLLTLMGAEIKFDGDAPATSKQK